MQKTRKQINFRCSEKEARRLERIAAHYGLSTASALRMLIKRESDVIRAKESKT